MRVFALLLGCAALVGCAPPLAAGSSCERNSDCPDRLACGFGRCRVECLADVDCIAGARCVFVSTGIGVCTLPSENACTTDACPAPLACNGGVCRASCGGEDECLPSQTCSGGVCIARPALDAGEGDGGVDTPTDAGTSFVAAAPCNDDSDCSAAELCAVHESPRICRTRCVDHGDCPTATACEPVVLVDDSIAYACSTLCLPGTNMGCRPDTSCRPIARSPDGRLPGGPEGILACTLTTPTGLSGCACLNLDLSLDCADGLVCDYSAARQCTAICELSTDCPNGPCARTSPSILVNGREYGICPQVTPHTCP